MNINNILAFVLVALLWSFAIADESESADKNPTPPAIDLHGKAYMGFIDLSDDAYVSVSPAGTEEAFLPVYFIWGQSGNVLYGGVVVPDETKKSSPTDITLRQYSIVQGKVESSTTISFTLDEIEDLGLYGTVKGDVQKNGKKINLYMQIPILGKVEIGDIFICNEKKKVSGQYLGTGDIVGPAASKANNAMIGLLIEKKKMSFTAFLYDPAKPKQPYTWTDQAKYNPKKGKFTYDGDESEGIPDVTGTISKGSLSMKMDLVNGSTAEGKLYFFSDRKAKKSKLKKLTPTEIPADETTKVRIKHVNVLIGSLVCLEKNSGVSASAESEEVKIIRYDYFSKYIDVWLDASDKAKGKYDISLVGPDGKTASASKTVSVK